MKKNISLFSFGRTRVMAAVSAGAILVLFALNLLLTSVGTANSLFFDLSYEELYTTSDLMASTCDTLFADAEEKGTGVTAIFCSDPDALIEKTASRVTYFMALRLQKEYENFHVKTVNVTQNPTAVAAYKTTSLSTISSTDMILVAGSRYRVMSLESYWVTNSDTSTYYSYNGEYRLACALASLLSVHTPTAYFITGHGETVWSETAPETDREDLLPMKELLEERGLRVGTLDLSACEVIPEDCVLLIINNPTADFPYDVTKAASLSYQSELEKIDRYLIDRQGSLLVAKDYATSLPNLEDYLREWGMTVSNARVEDTEHSRERDDGLSTSLIVKYDTSTDSYGQSIYGEVTEYASAAATVISNCGYITCSYPNDDSRIEDGSSSTRFYTEFLSSYETARSYNALHESVTDAGEHTLAAVTGRIQIDETTADKRYSYVCCAASGDFLGADLIGNTSYANYDIVSLLVDNISRVDVYASSDLGGTSLNSASSYGKVLLDTSMAETSQTVYASDGSVIQVTNPVGNGVRTALVLVAVIVPLTVAIAGAVICLRRRFL